MYIDLFKDSPHYGAQKCLNKSRKLNSSRIFLDQWPGTRNQYQEKTPNFQVYGGSITWIPFNNEWINNDIKEEIRNYQETNENEHTTTPKL